MISSIANYHERLVIERIHRVLEERQETADPGLIADLACLALNRLPPRYVRHIVDLALHMNASEHAQTHEHVKEAVAFAFATCQRRQDSRADDDL